MKEKNLLYKKGIYSTEKKWQWLIAVFYYDTILKQRVNAKSIHVLAYIRLYHRGSYNTYNCDKKAK